MHFTIVIHTKPFKDIFILHQAHKIWLFKFNGWSFSYRIKVKRILFGGSKLCILILWVWFIDCTQIQNTAGRNLNKDLTCKKLWCACLLARLKQLLSGHHHRYFLQRKNTTTSIIILSRIYSILLKHSVFNFISSSYQGIQSFSTFFQDDPF